MKNKNNLSQRLMSLIYKASDWFFNTTHFNRFLLIYNFWLLVILLVHLIYLPHKLGNFIVTFFTINYYLFSILYSRANSYWSIDFYIPGEGNFSINFPLFFGAIIFILVYANPSFSFFPITVCTCLLVITFWRRVIYPKLNKNFNNNNKD